jgi:hypothetical protein
MANALIPATIKRAVLAVGKKLRSELLRPGYGQGSSPLDGLCYVVSDVLMELFPGRFVMRRLQTPDHYFLRSRENREVVDLVLKLPAATYDQDRPGMRQKLSKRGRIFLTALQAHLAG